ncbi:putative receptor-like protein kinase At3g47110 [Telopea speciosissima]|uniref:putative receptor-like protein kinase At3g47110 n=1 Tax=Telopea speciosissima TaxID=54955 RepID=UPI001CC60FB7|nr:putative receptor-like protein kinase At3g47110 [Telopea speciosissima]
MGSNMIHGSIPVGIGNLISLTLLGMEGNMFTGTIPAALGTLKKLQKLYLNYNRLSGLIPSSISNLTQLIAVFMEENNLEGKIPASLGNCQNLLQLNLSFNNLSGTIPKEVISISSLSISFAVKHNSLTGSLPVEVGNLKNLVELEVSENKFSGEIPSTLGSCVSLVRLYMAGNSFQGYFPLSFEALRALDEVDLSLNKLSGMIPQYLEHFSFLKKLNLSFNDFEGEVPNLGPFANASAISVVGNRGLCGGMPKLQLPRCSKEAPHRGGKVSSSGIRIILPIVILTIVVISCLVTIFFWTRRPRKRALVASSSNDWQSRISYSELFRSTNGFSEDNLVGLGNFGSVYKAVIQESEAVVAVKVLNLQQRGASKSFAAECETLKNIRHRNLLKILTVCSSIDFEKKEFNAKVYEFMPNGNLDEWLHPRIGQIKPLNLIQRLNIAIDVAAALEYLHFDCETPIIHCDLPSNVLLDKDMTAHVGDFGLAQFLSERSITSSNSQSISIGLKGSIGYVPPGKSPTHDMFKDGRSLHEFAAAAWPERVMEIADPLMFLEEEEVPWYVEGDFNVTLLSSEKRGPGRFNIGSVANFQEIVDSCSLFQLPSQGISLPGRIIEEEVFLNLQIVRFGFINSSRSMRIHEGGAFPNINQAFDAAEAKLKEVQENIERNGMSDTLFNLEAEVKMVLLKATELHEKLWAEKSRNRWLKEGDRNSKIFHLSTKIRRGKSLIRSIKKEDGKVVSSQSDIVDYVVRFYESFHKKIPLSAHHDLLDCIA